ncbi:histone-lysine N-methyltransferase SUVR2 isoform X3 [Tripterygium wilfordii]|uniref:Histone-lysine N-methyltransferase SUVR2 isoform X3 n=1 Tax=Tripterygium wilfordii TaxID=458696 RepID=A0A7J7D642_TRIWF|nr:histone-lysine N-methyltransferase SUVR2 isoform X3 [Tripterygium wilfordii]
MAPNPRVTKAFRAMKAIGIAEEKVKPVLKKLLKLYEKNWELIEEENYRVLADAIFDEDDTKECEKNPNGGNVCAVSCFVLVFCILALVLYCLSLLMCHLPI